MVGVAMWGVGVQGAMCPGGVLGNCPTQQSNTSGGGKTSRDYCYTARIRSTVLQGLPFGGVPTVLALDFMCFLVSHFCFCINPALLSVTVFLFIFLHQIQINI